MAVQEWKSEELINICNMTVNILENRDLDQCDTRMYLSVIGYSLLAIAKELHAHNMQADLQKNIGYMEHLHDHLHNG